MNKKKKSNVFGSYLFWIMDYTGEYLIAVESELIVINMRNTFLDSN